MDALNYINDIQDKPNRQKVLAPFFEVRLESLERESDGVVCCEMIRIQRTNLPPEVEAESIIELSTNNPLGHSIVFRYDHARNFLGIQSDRRVIAIGRFRDYIMQMRNGDDYSFTPVIREDNWERFNRSPIRKVSFSIAGPSNLSDVDAGDEPAFVALQSMGEAYSAPSIKIEISVGHNRANLNDKIKEMVAGIRNFVGSENVDVRSLNAKIAKTDEEPSETIDLLEDVLSSTEELELHDKDPSVNYSIKMAALRRSMRDWQP